MSFFTGKRILGILLLVAMILGIVATAGIGTVVAPLVIPVALLLIVSG